MNEETFGQFLRGGIWVCVFMAVVSPLFRWRRFGPASLLLGCAFVALALLFHGLSESWPQPRIITIAVVLVLLLAADAILRSNPELKK